MQTLGEIVMGMRGLLLCAAGALAGCAVTYPVQVVDETSSLVVIRATGKTEYEALKSAEAKALDMVGVYIPQKEPTCNYNPGKGQQNLGGTGVYEDVGSWTECVVYAQKPK
jgi:hypothetical protein